MRWKHPEETNPPIDARDPELERLLQSMPLARVPDRLDQRVRLALAAGRPAGWFAVGALSATAAAAVIAFSLPLLRREVPSHVLTPAQVGLVKPVIASAHPIARLRVERDAERIDDAGIVGRVDGVPLRGIRRQAVRQIWYYDSERHVRLSVTVPDDQFVVVPVRAF